METKINYDLRFANSELGFSTVKVITYHCKYCDRATTDKDMMVRHENDHLRLQKSENLYTTEDEFKIDLANLINKHSVDTDVDEYDFLLADYLCKCLENYSSTSKASKRLSGQDE